MRLAREGVPIFGIAYKDKPEDSRASSAARQPFARSGGPAGPRRHRLGPLWRAGDLSDRQGGHRPLALGRGPVTEEVVQRQLTPLLRRTA